jgi:NAD-dependent dihydropyrimidine dehydrogenase PreA subunit
MTDIKNDKSKRKRPIIQFIKCPSCGYGTSTVSYGEAPQKACPNCKTAMESMAVPKVNRGPIPKIDSLVCTGCGKCIAVCPMGAIEMENQSAFIVEDRCVGCGRCLTVCSFSAITNPQ